MTKMDWDRVAREDRLRRFLAGPTGDTDSSSDSGTNTSVRKRYTPVRVRAGDLCTCSGRPFREGDPYYYTAKGSPRHHPVCPAGR